MNQITSSTSDHKRALLKGAIFILMAEFCFATSSVFAKYVVQDSNISGIQITFFRFLMGSVIGYVMLKKSNVSFKPVNKKMVAWRAVFNTISAMLFFYSLKFTTVTNANMLGLTYPLWVVIFAPLLIGEKFQTRNIIFVLLALIGVYLIVHPDFSAINPGDIFAFLSGVTASIAVIALRQARKTDSTSLIIFYLMITGVFINAIFLAPIWENPNYVRWIFIIISALLGIAAQLLITYGYRFIEASKGSLISSSRIVMAGAMGVIFFSDKITLQLIAGAILILSSQVGLLNMIKIPLYRRK